MLKECIMAILAGAAVGLLFRFLKLPLPAPPVLSAVMGVFGVYFGGKLFDLIQKWIA